VTISRATLLGLLLSVLALPSSAAVPVPPDVETPPPVSVATAPLQVGVITMAPGEEFWARFGHDAIVIMPADDPTQAVSYNFGFFDMDEPGFFGNFIRGKMNYQLAALPVREDLANYQEQGRGVSVQWLNLTPAQAQSLASALEKNAQPENAHYRYDYFTDNCTTRVRDALDRVLDGALKAQLSGRSMGNTYRSESVRLAWPAKWMAIGFDLGLGGYADRPLSRWDEAFIPMRLRDSLREIRLPDGRPLVASESQLLPHRLSMPPDEMPKVQSKAFFLGVMLALAALGLGRRQPRLLAALALPFWLIAGLAGSVMLFIWFGTAHVAGHANENILLLSPLSFLLLPGAWSCLRGRTPSARFGFYLWMIAGSAALAGFLTFFPFLLQQNLDWVLLLLPVHLALAKALSPKTADV
jgi:hypothetical protein